DEAVFDSGGTGLVFEEHFHLETPIQSDFCSSSRVIGLSPRNEIGFTGAGLGSRKTNQKDREWCFVIRLPYAHARLYKDTQNQRAAKENLSQVFPRKLTEPKPISRTR
ncbi:MAG: hypothetical protein AAF253_15075, partial [Pseudomonadota bacterium]